MGPARVVDVQISANRSQPEALDECVVFTRLSVIRAGRDLVLQQQIGKVRTGKLASLVLAENVRFAILGRDRVYGLKAEIGLQRDRDSPRQGLLTETARQVDNPPAIGTLTMSVHYTWFGRSIVMPGEQQTQAAPRRHRTRTAAPSRAKKPGMNAIADTSAMVTSRFV